MLTSVGPSMCRAALREGTNAMEFGPTFISSMRTALLQFGNMRMIFRSRDRLAGGALHSGRYRMLLFAGIRNSHCSTFSCNS